MYKGGIQLVFRND